LTVESGWFRICLVRLKKVFETRWAIEVREESGDATRMGQSA